MKVFVFRGEGDLFGFSTEQSGDNLPSSSGQWMRWVYQPDIELLKGQKRIAIDVDAALKDIASNGYHLTEVQSKFEVILDGKIPHSS